MCHGKDRPIIQQKQDNTSKYTANTLKNSSTLLTVCVTSDNSLLLILLLFTFPKAALNIPKSLKKSFNLRSL